MMSTSRPFFAADCEGDERGVSECCDARPGHDRRVWRLTWMRGRAQNRAAAASESPGDMARPLHRPGIRRSADDRGDSWTRHAPPNFVWFCSSRPWSLSSRRHRSIGRRTAGRLRRPDIERGRMAFLRGGSFHRPGSGRISLARDRRRPRSLRRRQVRRLECPRRTRLRRCGRRPDQRPRPIVLAWRDWAVAARPDKDGKLLPRRTHRFRRQLHALAPGGPRGYDLGRTIQGLFRRAGENGHVSVPRTVWARVRCPRS